MATGVDEEATTMITAGEIETETGRETETETGEGREIVIAIGGIHTGERDLDPDRLCVYTFLTLRL